MAVLFGLLAALLLGISDFVGARSATRTTPLQSTTAAFLGGALAAAVYSPLLGSPSTADLVLGAVSGIFLSAGLTLLWQGYVQSSIGVAGAVASVVSTVIPVVWDAAGGQAPGWLGWLGVAVGLTALVLTSWQAGARVERGAVLGLLSGVFLAAMYLTSVSTSASAGTWPIVPQRATAFAIAAGVSLARRQRVVGDARSTGWCLLAGMFGASGVASIVYAGQRHPLAPVVVSSSMYIPVAAFLAWVFLHQQLSRRQMLGLIGAVLGVVLIALD